MKIHKLTEEKLFFLFFRLSAYIGFLILFVVLLLLIIAGAKVINWTFLTSYWHHSDITTGGIFQAIVGSLYLGIGVTVVSFPLGIGTAIYLTEYSRENVWRRIIVLAIRNLAGVPSVVYGIFGLAVFVNFFVFGTSLLSAILTLSIMTLPWIITASIEALEAVPEQFRESSLALGATKWQTILRIILPAALPTSITGSIISNARAMGETAPIIMVGATFYMSGLPTSIYDKFMALPYHTFILATQHSSPYASTYAAGTAFILILFTMLLSFGSILIRYYYRKKKEW